jgi:TonB family protein
MRTVSLLFLALVLANSLHASQEPPELQEATRLTESVEKLFNEKKFDEALPLAQRALQLREKLLSASDERIQTSLGYLGDLYFASRNYGPARKAFERLLRIQETAYGPTDLKVAFTLDRLAVVYDQQRQPARAEAMYHRSLALREKVLPDGVLVADTLFALGQLYRTHGDTRRALESYKRALTNYGRIGGTKTAEFERTSTAISCLAYESVDLNILKDLEEVQKQFGSTAAKRLELLNRTAISMPKPEYPVAAKELRLQGIVVVHAEINEEGNVISAEDLCQGPPYLSEAAVKAALNARFTPKLVSGTPVKVKGVLRYNFVNNGTIWRMNPQLP